MRFPSILPRPLLVDLVSCCQQLDTIASIIKLSQELEPIEREREREREREGSRGMGRMNQQPETVIHHFSHSHPLQLSNHHPQQTLTLASCSGCKLKASGLIYDCKRCNYFLHISCSQMPQQITHSFHKAHALSLLPNPAYPEGLFNCDACGKQGNGFSYHCGVCNIDLHILCASKPLFLNHQSHHHRLALSFSPPYHNKSFSCDICRQIGTSHWLYRCDECEFDAHLSCATATPAAPIQAPLQQNFMQQFQTASRATPHGHFPRNQTAIGQNYMQQLQTTQPTLHCQFPTGQNYMQQFQTTPRAILPGQFPGTQVGTGQNYPPMNQVNNLNPGVVYRPVRPAATSGQGNSLLSQAIDGLVNGAAQQVGMNIVQGLLGGGGGGGSTALDAGGGGTWDGGSSSVSYDCYSGTDGG